MTTLFGGHAPRGMRHIECAECLMPFTVKIGEGLPASHKCDPQYAKQAKAARKAFGSKPYPQVQPATVEGRDNA